MILVMLVIMMILVNVVIIVNWVIFVKMEKLVILFSWWIWWKSCHKKISEYICFLKIIRMNNRINIWINKYLNISIFEHIRHTLIWWFLLVAGFWGFLWIWWFWCFCTNIFLFPAQETNMGLVYFVGVLVISIITGSIFYLRLCLKLRDESV